MLNRGLRLPEKKGDSGRKHRQASKKAKGQEKIVILKLENPVVIKK